MLAVNIGLVVRGLRTVGAILRAAAGLDAEEHTALHLVGAVVGTLSLLRSEDQIGQRRGVDRFDLVDSPIVSDHRFESLSEREFLH